MPPDRIPPDIILPSEQRLRDIEAVQMFGRRTVRSVYVVAGLAGAALFLRGQLHRTALLVAIDPTFHATLIGAGVFVGILLAAVEYDGWRLGIGRVRGQIPSGIGALVCMAVLVGLCGVGGSYVASQLAEWEAFHGLVPQSSEEVFLVVDRTSSRSGDWLELAPASGGAQFSITCGSDMYRALSAGDRIMLPVQTGRHGIQRVVLPPLETLRRG